MKIHNPTCIRCGEVYDHYFVMPHDMISLGFDPLNMDPDHQFPSFGDVCYDCLLSYSSKEKVRSWAKEVVK